MVEPPPMPIAMICLALVDVLSMGMAVNHKNRSRDKLRRLKVALDSYRGGGDRQPLGD